MPSKQKKPCLLVLMDQEETLKRLLYSVAIQTVDWNSEAVTYLFDNDLPSFFIRLNQTRGRARGTSPHPYALWPAEERLTTCLVQNTQMTNYILTIKNTQRQGFQESTKDHKSKRRSRSRSKSKNSGRQRETTRANEGQRGATGGNGRQRGTTGANGFK